MAYLVDIKQRTKTLTFLYSYGSNFVIAILFPSNDGVSEFQRSQFYIYEGVFCIADWIQKVFADAAVCKFVDLAFCYCGLWTNSTGGRWGKLNVKERYSKLGWYSIMYTQNAMATGCSSSYYTFLFSSYQ